MTLELAILERSFQSCETGGVSIIFLSGPIGAGKTTVAKALLPLLPSPLSYIEGDTFWSFIRKGGERGLRDNFPVLVRSMTAAAVPFARSCVSSFDRLLNTTYLRCYGTQDPEGSAV